MAMLNAEKNGAVTRREEVVGTTSECRPCLVESTVLTWGVDEAAVVAAKGPFHFVVASEVLYIHWVRGVL
jgi:hypothetical protein